ncbi:hypothetical protein GUITHDRAFT_146350 [Guillardia theta CCMP2712]|uniref:YABBY protein C-terminal domain-containing protein n=1 Tax=Guillardia theta (strain CCMP2712) TaxID=905079 RepID=L1IH94_GUITC|nr:hypothetical protein GUITHDRAFT_146350 [Guillardia theta CCMP2712]EKX35613.1 hypothetical protein GUITHDRAFT_146350 [Guillardia theta CCMP2712]|eukprot:XP_005822593.1 hypothetical protein GUITHDRAFT_146350 [Guillardia theta CCMP2712]
MEGGSSSAAMEVEKSESAAVRPQNEATGQDEEMKGGEGESTAIDSKAEDQGEPKELTEAAEGEDQGGASKADEGTGLKLMAQYKVACLNCGVQLYIELPPNCASFQCCQCHAVHKILQPDPSLAAGDSKKRKRKEKRDKKEGEQCYPSSLCIASRCFSSSDFLTFKDKEPRELSGYNKFMRTQLNILKETNPELGHKEMFKLATEKWATSPDNPKNAAPQGQEEGKKPLEGSEGLVKDDENDEDKDEKEEEDDDDEGASESQGAQAEATEGDKEALKPVQVLTSASVVLRSLLADRIEAGRGGREKETRLRGERRRR